MAPAEEALESLFERLAGLERETAALSDSLRRFRDEWRERVGASEGELFAAKRLEDRILRLSAEAERWRLPRPDGLARRGRRKRTRPGPSDASMPLNAAREPTPPWIELKELYRLVVRRLHPDFARSDAERARSSELMARVNAAYARGDRVLIELVHARALSHDDSTETTLEKRESHAERRLETLLPIAASLEKELALLRASSHFRDLETASVMAERGRDYFAERLQSIRRDARDALARALAGAATLGDRVQKERVRSRTPRTPEPGSLLRHAAHGLEKKRAGADAQALRAELERKATKEPWYVALALFAFFAEATPEPPPGLVSLAALRDRHEALRARWPAAPGFERALLGLPPFLEVGLRAYPDRLAFGLQMKRPELLAGVRDCMGTRAVLPVARLVFESLGPAAPCVQCDARVFEVHLLRSRGAGDVHALICPACGGISKSYRTLGKPEGLEALSFYARRLGVVVEQRVRIGDLSLVLELLPREHERLTALTLLGRLRALYPAALPDPLLPFARFCLGRARLPPSAPVAGAVRLVLAAGAPVSEKSVAGAIRAAARFTRSDVNP